MDFGFSRLAPAAILLAMTVPAVVDAADPNVLQGLYHDGVKSFYGGDYTRAAEVLSTAIDAGSKDPRSYYFRGLSRLRLGKRSDADADFKQGAAIEGRDFDAFFNVSRSMERIQGGERLMLERYRTDGRKNALAELESIRFERFRRFQTGASGPAAPAGGAAPAATGAPAEGAMPAGPATPAAPVNPFGAPATPAATPETPVNPFGAPAATPATPPAAAPPAAPANPFGGSAPAAAPAAPATPATPPANPFGT
jgi:hypothetical protein